MEDFEIINALSNWASQKPLVNRLHIFGSRARGDHRPDSDIDIAIELDMFQAKGCDESGGFATWVFDTEGWREELEVVTGLEVDLQRSAGDQTPTIQRGLRTANILVYEKHSRNRT